MGNERSDRVFPRWMIALAIIAAVGITLYGLRGVLTPVFFAFLIAYMLDPVVDWFEARKVSRGVGIAVVLTLSLGPLGLFVLLAIPGIISDVVAFARELPVLAERLVAQAQPLLDAVGVSVPHSMSDAMEQFGISGEQVREALGGAGAALRWLLGGTASIVGAAAGLLIIPVFAAYLLHDFDRITAGIGDLVPGRWRPFVVDVAREVDTVLGEFIRGQVLVMVILAVLYSTAYGLLGVRLAILIGVVAGIVSFIPYLGGAVALGLAVIMCLLDWSGWGQLVGVVVAYAIIQTVEGFVITPKIVGDKVGLSAVWVLFALMVGGELFGFLGVLLALPAAAVIKIFVMRGLEYYRESSFFLSTEDGTGAPARREGVLSGLLHAEGLPDDARTKEKKASTQPPAPSDPPSDEGDPPVSG